MLYPKMNAVRQVFDLNGIWNFKLISDELDRKEQAGRFLKKSLPCLSPQRIMIFTPTENLQIMSARWSIRGHLT